MVEVGYSVDPAYRRRGYARAAMQELLDRAIADPSVRVLRASISPDNEPSLNLVASFGLERNGEQWDEEDGLEWIFEIPDAPLVEAALRQRLGSRPARDLDDGSRRAQLDRPSISGGR